MEPSQKLVLGLGAILFVIAIMGLIFGMLSYFKESNVDSLQTRVENLEDTVTNHEHSTDGTENRNPTFDNVAITQTLTTPALAPFITAGANWTIGSEEGWKDHHVTVLQSTSLQNWVSITGPAPVICFGSLQIGSFPHPYMHITHAAMGGTLTFENPSVVGDAPEIALATAAATGTFPLATDQCNLVKFHQLSANQNAAGWTDTNLRFLGVPPTAVTDVKTVWDADTDLVATPIRLNIAVSTASAYTGWVQIPIEFQIVLHWKNLAYHMP